MEGAYEGDFYFTPGPRPTPDPEPPVRDPEPDPVLRLFGADQFVPRQPGRFQMGSTDGWPDEAPVHMVEMSRVFEMGKYEVTRAPFRTFVEATGYDAESGDGCWVYTTKWERQAGASWRNTFVGDDRPVVCVSWLDAQAMMDWLNRADIRYRYRLPTEAEWEYAARAGTTGKYAGDLDELGWYVANSGGKTHAVGQKRSNAWGLYDMHGNVWEWVQDWYDSAYYGSSPGVDPSGASSGLDRVLRGGGWHLPAEYARAAIRFNNTPGYRINYLGFRLVRTAR